MTPRRLVRLELAGLALSLTAGGLLMVTSPVDAVVLGTPVTKAVTVFGKAVACTFSPSATPNTTTPGVFSENGVPVTVSTSSSTTISQPGDSSTASASVTHTVSATAANGVLKTVHVEDSLQASVSADLGAATTCNPSAQAAGQATFTLDLPTPKYLVVQSETFHAEFYLTFFRATTVGGEPVIDLSFPDSGPHVVRTMSYYLPVGSYTFTVGLAATAKAPGLATSATSRTGTGVTDLDFEDPGVATAAAEGKGGRYVDLAAGRSCSTGTVAATWKRKAGKGSHRTVKKATFYVNGVKAKSVRTPKKKQVTTLTGLDPLEAADVLVKLKLVEHGTGTLTLERSYLACG